MLKIGFITKSVRFPINLGQFLIRKVCHHFINKLIFIIKLNYKNTLIFSTTIINLNSSLFKIYNSNQSL